jgi:HAMP domain-containing protein
MADAETAKAAADAASDTGFWAAVTAAFGALTAFVARKTGRASREAEIVRQVTEIAASSSGHSTQLIVAAIDAMRDEIRALATEMREARRESFEREARIARSEGRR